MSSPSSEASPTPVPEHIAGDPLRAEERRAWERDGFLVRHRVLPETTLAGLRGAADHVEARVSAWLGRGRPYRVDGLGFRDVGAATLQYEHDPAAAHCARVIEPAHHLAPALDALVDDAGIATPAAALIGAPGLSLFSDKLNWKRPRTGSGFDWHQDAPYWAEVPGLWARLDRLVNVLVALDDADETNGCFRVRAGSHRDGMLATRRGSGALDPLFLEAAALAPYPEVALPLAAGSAVFFHACLAHGSRPNETPRQRRAVVLTYQPSGYRMFKVDRVREVRAQRSGTRTPR